MEGFFSPYSWKHGTAEKNIRGSRFSVKIDCNSIYDDSIKEPSLDQRFQAVAKMWLWSWDLKKKESWFAGNISKKQCNYDNKSKFE